VSRGAGERCRVRPVTRRAQVGVPKPYVLIIAAHEETRSELERSLPDAIPRRSTDAAPQPEGHGSQVIVVAGAFPLAGLVEVRAHARLHDIPVVLFAPGQDLPVMDWGAVSFWPVVTEHNALGQLIGHVRRLYRAGRGLAEPRTSLL
jgi:hypothetical protein